MKKVLGITLKWFVRIILGIAGLIVLIMLVFYIFRGMLLDKTLDYVNRKQPGELHIEKLYFRPFLDFPDVSLQLRTLDYFGDANDAGSGIRDSIFTIEDIFISLDVVQLLKGRYKVAEIRIGDGEINYTVSSDSISNIEKALGIRFGEAPDTVDVKDDSTKLSLDLKSLKIRNMKINYNDEPGKVSASLKINGLESGFSYLPELITAAIMVHLDLANLSTKELVLDKPRSVSLNSSLVYNQIDQHIALERTALAINDAILELNGQVDLSGKLIDVNFDAQNRGIELLNFLLNGVLNMDAIRQVGEGEINFNGNISGSYANSLPEINMHFSASEMAFNINTLDQTISEIGFAGNLTNGKAKDYSEASFNIDNFHMKFPKGSLDATVNVSNLIAPKVLLQIEGDADLSVLNEILSIETVKDMRGKLDFNGGIDARINADSGEFLDNSGALLVNMNNVGFSIPDYSIENLDGEFYMEDLSVGFRNMLVSIDSNTLSLDGKINNLLPYLFGFSANPKLTLEAKSEELFYYKLLGDTLFKEPIRDLEFKLIAGTTAEGLHAAIDSGFIPNLNVEIHDLKAKYPGYADISDLKLLLSLEEQNLNLSKIEGKIGKSDFNFDASISNYKAFILKDSSAEISANFHLGGKQLNLADLFTFNNQFTILPPEFSLEEIRNFNFKGKIQTTVDQLLTNSDLPEIIIQCDTFFMDLKYYPNSIGNLAFEIQHLDTLIQINRFTGSIGSSNFDLDGKLVNLLDSGKVKSGYLNIKSDLLDINKLTDYTLLEHAENKDMIGADSLKQTSAELHKIDFPDLAIQLDLKQFRFEGYDFYDIHGDLRLKPYKIVYLDKFSFQSRTGGSVLLDGQFNVADSSMYTLSAALKIDTLTISDFDIQLAMGDSLYSLEDNFNGILSAEGLAEFFINPDLSINLDTSTAVFNIVLEDGRVRNFTPLHAIGKYTGNKDLDNVKFGELRNSFTLADGAVSIPLMSISSTLGLILIEGEQGLGGDFLYLVRVPPKLIRGTAWNVVSNQQRKETKDEQEVQTLQSQNFVLVTISGIGEDTEVKIGDKRDKFSSTSTVNRK